MPRLKFDSVEKKKSEANPATDLMIIVRESRFSGGVA